MAIARYDAHRPPFRPGLVELFDSILCDPPYGVRAGGRKSGGRKPKEKQQPIPDELRDAHIPSTAVYTLHECLYDLLQFSATYLRVGGRVSFWMVRSEPPEPPSPPSPPDPPVPPRLHNHPLLTPGRRSRAPVFFCSRARWRCTTKRRTPRIRRSSF